MYLIAKEGNEGVLLNAHLNKWGIRDLESMIISRESSNMRKDVINILSLSVLYL
jgi:hypothetical protein